MSRRAPVPMPGAAPVPGRPLGDTQRAWIRALVLQRGIAPVDAEDITQNVLLAIARGGPIVPEGRSPEEAFRSWCCGVVHRQVASWRRQRVRQAPELCGAAPTSPDTCQSAAAAPDPPMDDLVSPVPTAEDLLVADTELAMARLVFEELRAKQAARHAVLVAYEVEERPMSEIAASMGITTNTAWNRLRLAREDARASWQRLAARQSLPRDVRQSLPRDVRQSLPRDVRQSLPRDVRQSLPHKRGAQSPARLAEPPSEPHEISRSSPGRSPRIPCTEGAGGPPEWSPRRGRDRQ